MKYLFFKLMKKCKKNDVKVGVGKMKKKTFFSSFKCSLNFKAHAPQSAFEKKNKKNSIKIRQKRTIIWQLKKTLNQCKMSYMRKKHIFL